ncbi:MAG: hypothetical protein Q4D62_04290 [Planctomycetia bacterium]|nr:hypothetical protein [Planctomycetia bacterium]
MDDSKFYRDWLDLDVPPGITPTYYQLLNLPHLEKRIPTIQAAVRSRIEQFRQIDFGENRDAYLRLLQLLVEARFVLLTAELKREYDMRCSEEGRKQWQTYERPSLSVRLKQAGMISAAFLLGLSVSLVMAMTVARNPDGTVKYTHSRAVSQKTEWFTTPPGKEFPRPTPPLRRPLVENRDSDESSATAMIVTGDLEKNIETESNFSNPATSLTTVEAEEEVEVRTTPRLRGNRQRRSPLHRMTEKSDTTLAANTSETTSPLSEVTPPLPEIAPESASDLPQALSALPETPPFVEEKMEEKAEPTLDETLVSTEVSELSPSQQAREWLENAQALPQENHDRAALFQKSLDLAVRSLDVSLASEILDAMKESYHLPMLALKQKTLQSLTEGLAKTVDTLSDKKPLDDLEEFGWKVSLELLDADQCQEAAEACQRIYEVVLAAPEFLEKNADSILRKKESCDKIYAIYQTYVEAAQKLETAPDDPQANRKVALWYLQKKKDLTQALPYFAKCDQSMLQQLAQKELAAIDSLTPNAQNLLEVADGWWDVARFFPKGVNEVIYQHATALYEKIDRDRLNQGEQVRVVERIEKQRK